MKVCTYHRSTALGVFKRLGVFYNESVVIDINITWRIHFQELGFHNATELADKKYPTSLNEFLNTVDNPIEALKEAVIMFNDQLKREIYCDVDGAVNGFDLSEDDSVCLGAPLDKVTSYRDFYTHEKHVAKGFEKRNEPIPKAWYEIPAYYKGSTTGFIGDGEIALWPKYSDKLDYELELACIIGNAGKNIEEDEAHNYIFGFTILNDISARDIQKKEMAVRLGPAKGKDFCSIIGPVITTADEFNFEEPNLLMTATINGEEWSRGQSGDAYYTWNQMIAHASAEEWLLPGDLLGSGTVGTGCGLEIDKWIQPGDKIELFVEKIGTLTNIIGTPTKEE
jgi:2-keto-4-pentenoate hydratase/2-oxohepta-3-ene-1,7-dioic acid hydratase in catechol pathway